MSGLAYIPGVMKKEGLVGTPISQMGKPMQGNAVKGWQRGVSVGECPVEGTCRVVG